MTAHIHQSKAKYATLGIWYSLALAPSTVRQRQTLKNFPPLKKEKGESATLLMV